MNLNNLSSTAGMTFVLFLALESYSPCSIERKFNRILACRSSWLGL